MKNGKPVSKKRKSTKARPAKDERGRMLDITTELVMLQQELFNLGLRYSSGRISKVIDVLGYEMALADLKAGRITPSARRQREYVGEREGPKALAKFEAASIRDAERDLNKALGIR